MGASRAGTATGAGAVSISTGLAEVARLRANMSRTSIFLSRRRAEASTILPLAKLHRNPIGSPLARGFRRLGRPGGKNCSLYYTFGPYFGLPDGSPFVTKAMLLLKMAGLDYVEDRKATARPPRASCPISTTTAKGSPTSTFIRLHVEKKYGFDLRRRPHRASRRRPAGRWKSCARTICTGSSSPTAG